MKIIVTMLTLVLLGSNAVAQSINLPVPAGSVNFGYKVTVLPNGNYVVTDPSWSSGGSAKVGAVYLYNGANDNLISTITGSQADDMVGNGGITILSNGNYTINSLNWANGSPENASAFTFGNATTGVSGVVSAGNSLIAAPYNSLVVPLNNGNYVILSPYWKNSSSVAVGAITWCNASGTTVGSISSSNSLVGSTADDRIGYDGIRILPNGNYLVKSSLWDNGSATDAGAITWCSATIGSTGFVGSSNSLVGSSANDKFGIQPLGDGITILSNGSYVVANPYTDNGGSSDAGSATWGNSATGISGIVSSSNSLVGTRSNDQVGSKIAILSNGNYVVSSASWANGSGAGTGAATWGSGTVGVSGIINSSNSLIGSTAGDGVGRAIALTNGNYVVSSPSWKNGGINAPGAVTWCSGITGGTGVVSSLNSLTGVLNNSDGVGTVVTPLVNGNYVVGSPNWGTSFANPNRYGAFTWCSGSGSTVGVVSASNSIVGSNYSDYVGGSITALTNGAYVVISSGWMNGTAANAGAATWGNGTIPQVGLINAGNSLVGTLANDKVGKSGIILLSNGNYIVHSDYCANGSFAWAGAVTWGSASTGVSGNVSIANSLMGGQAGCLLGIGGIIGNKGIYSLANGNYVVNSPFWKTGGLSDVGAVTWGNGATGISGLVSSINSLVGSQSDDGVGSQGITTLNNGNYVVNSSSWKNGSLASAGAVTWGNGSIGVSGAVSAANSLVGGKANDRLGDGSLGNDNAITAYNDGNYVVKTANWSNGNVLSVGAGTLGKGNGGTVGLITSCNSILGPSQYYGAYSNYPYSVAYGKLLGSNSYLNFVKVFTPLYNQPATTTQTASNTTTGNQTILFTTSGCSLIAALTPSGSSPVSGNISASVNVVATAPTNAGAVYVRRSYDITPASGANTATATITLYFTQADFDDYNSNNGTDPDLPTGPGDNTGRANLIINQQHGSSSTGNFGTYTGWGGTGPANIVITPGISNVIWNPTLLRWEVTFMVTGFSGFFVKSQAAVLPVKWLAVSGSLNAQKQAIINFKVQEYNVNSYVLERSSNGSSFSPIASIASQGDGVHNYSYTDIRAVQTQNFYRIQQKDVNDRIVYSPIVKLATTSDNAITVYPVPAQSIIVITVPQNLVATNAVLFDNAGRRLKTILLTNTSFTTDVSSLAAGVYILHFANGSSKKMVKE